MKFNVSKCGRFRVFSCGQRDGETWGVYWSLSADS